MLSCLHMEELTSKGTSLSVHPPVSLLLYSIGYRDKIHAKSCKRNPGIPASGKEVRKHVYRKEQTFFCETLLPFRTETDPVLAPSLLLWRKEGILSVKRQ